jgi:hypothetical protein
MKNILIKSKSSKMSCSFFFFFFFFFFFCCNSSKNQVFFFWIANGLSLFGHSTFSLSGFLFIFLLLSFWISRWLTSLTSHSHIFYFFLYFFLSSCMWPPLLFVCKKSSYYNFYKNKIISCINKSIKIKISN